MYVNLCMDVRIDACMYISAGNVFSNGCADPQLILTSCCREGREVVDLREGEHRDIKSVEVRPLLDGERTARVGGSPR